jgi:hypothetical protein
MAQVTIVSVEACDRVTCPQLGAPASRIVLSSGSQQWSLSLRIPGMPSDFLKVGTVFDLTVNATKAYPSAGTSQQIVLAHAGQLVLFSAHLTRFPIATFASLPSPNLEAYGIKITATEPLCETTFPGVCRTRQHAARVTLGKDSGTVAPGETVKVGSFSFSSSYYEVTDFLGGGCDLPAAAVMAGFNVN